MLDIAEPRPAVLLLDRDAQHAEFSKLRPKLARKLVRPVDVISKRSNFRDGEAPHALANGIGSVAKTEVEAAIVVSGHLSNPGSLERTPCNPGVIPFASKGLTGSSQRANACQDNRRPPLRNVKQSA